MMLRVEVIDVLQKAGAKHLGGSRLKKTDCQEGSGSKDYFGIHEHVTFAIWLLFTNVGRSRSV